METYFVFFQSRFGTRLEVYIYEAVRDDMTEIKWIILSQSKLH